MKSQQEVLNCKICRMDIGEKEEFCELITYYQRHLVKSTGFYHIECFRERLRGGKEVSRSLERANQILNKAAEKLGIPTG